MEKFELIFIPGPGMGHLGSTVEMANRLLDRDHRFSVTVLAIKLPLDTKTNDHIHSLSVAACSANKPIRFIVLPEQPIPQVTNKGARLRAVLESYKSGVRDAVTHLPGARTGPDSPRLAGFVIDMFCTAMIDVAKEFGLPCYVFFTSNASFLSLSLHLQELYDRNDSNDAVEQLSSSNTELAVPGFVNPIPGRVIPSIFFDEGSAVWLYANARKFRSEIKGILINTFAEVESRLINAISSGCTSKVPQLYSVGPVLNLKTAGGTDLGGEGDDVIKWLDDQPTSSVVFLCFGSMGCFDEDQVKEIAKALERSGVRFLWSLRQPPPKGKLDMPKDYADTGDVLPEGFLDRTAGLGKVIGWAPQMEILAHPATGGFVSHCGWNSILESLWHGVPMATWPMYAEQQLNAFEMVVELGLSVEISLDYRKDRFSEAAKMVSATEIESGIRKLMEDGDEIRKKVKAKSEESRKATMAGGSSFTSLGLFIEDVFINAP